MIVYSSTKRNFVLDTLSNEISSKIERLYVKETGYKANKSEVAAWSNSMQFMKNIIEDTEIPEDVGIAIEYKIPQTSNRIDFIITGKDESRKTAILIELKQWSEGIGLSQKDAVVDARFYGGGTPHPSYQVWSYASLLNDYNEAVQEKQINLEPCAYLHNYSVENGVLNDPFYSRWTDKAPIFFREDFYKLRDFIKKYVKHGDQGTLMYEIEHGKIRPSKSLADSLASMLKNNQEFVLIDEQKVVYETALQLASEATDEVKNILIVKGGPGTGKSVVAINLLVELTNREQVTKYITRNSAPRQVYEAKLTGDFIKSRISNLFGNSWGFYEAEPNTFDSIIVDEAHRLNEKSGLYGNLGENQIKEIINASKFSVFFVDEDQRVTLKDIGTPDEIRRWAEQFGANVTELELESQFRCNGSDGYLAWLDDVLQIRETANTSLSGIDYNFQVIDSPGEMHGIIRHRNESNNKSRVVAGYCWQWVSDKDPEEFDIEIDGYRARWNLKSDGQAWLIKPNSVSEVGCIHTCQGLELDYVAVIVGPDLIVRNGKVITDASKRASRDKSVHGYKKMLKEDPERAEALGDLIVKNTYRTLMTRGMKGCFIYSTDPETQEYFSKRSQALLP